MDHNALRRIPALKDSSSAELSLLAAYAKTKKYGPGESLVSMADETSRLQIITAGYVKVHRTSVKGDEIIVAIRTVGDFLGELSVLDGQPPIADVTALDSVNVIELSSESVRALLSQNPKIIVSILVSRLREATITVSEMATRTLEQRAAALLCSLARRHGAEVRNGIELPPIFTSVVIASLVGNSKEEVSRTLSKFRKRGYIQRGARAKQIVIEDFSALDDLGSN
ncbi:MAG TPA: Crp/Fnr family transcriptional regulator [Capsulimonadaceae bacterium]|jgi:CRP-like cAMP-binding protein